MSVHAISISVLCVVRDGLGLVQSYLPRRRLPEAGQSRFPAHQDGNQRDRH